MHAVIIYFTVYFFIWLLSFIECFFLRKRNSTVFAYLIFCCICILSFFKPLNSTSDSASYYNHLIGVDSGSEFEIGYRFFIYLLQILNFSDYGFLTLSVVFFSLVIKMLSSYNATPYLLLPIAIYTSHFFLYQELTQLRSALASSLVILAIFMMLERKQVLSLIIYCISLSFHKSALIFMPGFFIVKSNVRISFYQFFLLLIVSILFSFILKDFIVYVAEDLVSEAIFKTYIEGEDGYAKSVGLFNPATLKYVFLSFLFILFSTRIESKYYNPLLNLYLFGTLWIILFSSFGTLAGRGAFFFTVYEMFLISFVIKAFCDKKIKLIAFCCTFIIYTIILFVNLNFKNMLIV